MKKLKNPILRATLSAALGLVVSVSAVAVDGTPRPDSDPNPVPNCFSNSNSSQWAIIKKFCKSGCTLDPGCCQVWVLKDFSSPATQEFRFCAGTAYQCDTTATPSGYFLCRDAFGTPATPAVAASS